jgi:anti-sigma B factor antagonist
MNPSLEVTTDTRTVGDCDVAIVRVRGEIDLATADRLTRAPAGCEQTGRLVLDLNEVGFIDSSGLRVVMMAARDFESRLGVLFVPGSSVERLFEIAQVVDRIPAFPTQEAAVAALADGGPQ